MHKRVGHVGRWGSISSTFVLNFWYVTSFYYKFTRQKELSKSSENSEEKERTMHNYFSFKKFDEIEWYFVPHLNNNHITVFLVILTQICFHRSI